jgi:hypothetical protein
MLMMYRSSQNIDEIEEVTAETEQKAEPETTSEEKT